jgi:hypothetical protein
VKKTGYCARKYAEAKELIFYGWGWIVNKVVSFANKPKPKKEPENPTDKAARRTAIATIWIAVFTVLLAFVSGFTLLILRGQLHEMQGGGIQTDHLLCLYQQQLAEMQKQSLQSQLSSIASTYQAVAVAQSESAMLLATSGNPVAIVNSKFRIPLRITNEGKTQAIDFQYRANAVFVPREKDDFSFRRFNKPFTFAGAILAAGKSIPEIGTPEAYVAVRDDEGREIIADNRTISDMRTGKKDVILYSMLTYRDVFQVKHWTRTCKSFAEYMPLETMISTPHPSCIAYNKQDQNQILPSRSASSFPAPPPQSLSNHRMAPGIHRGGWRCCAHGKSGKLSCG